MVALLGFLWSHIFNIPLKSYFPFFATGFVIWTWFSNQINNAANGFFPYQNIIKQINLPFPVYTLRSNVNQCLVFFHNFIIIIIVLLIFDVELNLNTLLFIPGLILLQLIISFLTIIVTIMCTRFQDMTPVINVIVQIVFFTTPIIWQTTSLKGNLFIIDFNPVYHWIEIIRAPLLGTIPSLENFYWTLGSLALSILLACILLGKTKSKISFWI